MKTKVLIVSTVGLIYDGITSVILSYLQAMDRSGLDIYVVSTVKCELEIRNKIQKLGCTVVDLPSRRTDPARYFLKLIGVIRKNNIKVIHAHGNSATLAIEMFASWLGGCKKRIAHSHNTRCDQVKIDKLLRPFFYCLYTDAIACGKEAGIWLFGKRFFTVLKNGRDLELYKYDENSRYDLREKLNIGENIAIGHVGGFVLQKNHEFLLLIYEQIHRKNPNARLFMIGDGELRSHIEEQAKRKELYEVIDFMGNINWIPELMSALDVMVFPSRYEGLPLAVIEWQISGLPCILSNQITEECSFTDHIKFLSLDSSAAEWADEVLAMNSHKNRQILSEKAKEQAKIAGFDIRDSVDILRQIYSTS